MFVVRGTDNVGVRPGHSQKCSKPEKFQVTTYISATVNVVENSLSQSQQSNPFNK